MIKNQKNVKRKEEEKELHSFQHVIRYAIMFDTE